MNEQYVIVMSYSDRSGIMGVFGTFQTESHAQRIVGELEESLWVQGGIFEVVKLVDALKF